MRQGKVFVHKACIALLDQSHEERRTILHVVQALVRIELTKVNNRLLDNLHRQDFQVVEHLFIAVTILHLRLSHGSGHQGLDLVLLFATAPSNLGQFARRHSLVNATQLRTSTVQPNS